MEDVPLPAVGPGDVLIRVRAASLNPIDFKFMRGDLRRVQKLSFPAPFGFDASGLVEEVGRDVRQFRPGQAVFTRAPRLRMGAFAEFLAVDAGLVAPRPERLSDEEAASIPLVGLTTVQGLVDRAGLRAGQEILIQAGSGGLGSFAIQYAAWLGARVTATTSSRNADWVGALGAERVICYDREDYRRDADRYDVVFDTLGGSATAASFGVLKRGGTVVSVAGPPDRWMPRQVGAGPLLTVAMRLLGLPIELRAWAKSARYFRYLTESNGAQLADLGELLQAGRIRPVIDQVFPFERALEALDYAAAGRAKGKVIVRMPAG